MNPQTDKKFAGSIPEIYDTHMVPLIFEPYADDLVQRLRAKRPSRVLEVAAGTGVVTRAMAAGLSPDVSIVATDLNQAMLDRAARRGTKRPVEWRQADGMALPFPDASFDALVCQFGVMFFPDKAKAFAEARRVLKSGGWYLFNVWDRIAESEVADIVTNALETVFPQDPPRFLARTPHGYHDPRAIEADLRSGGFGAAQVDTVAARSRAASARIAAVAYCQGTPLRNEIESRNASGLSAATDAAEIALAKRFGRGAVDGKIQALVVAVQKQ
jgi:SAM-dependent methyltransferase